MATAMEQFNEVVVDTDHAEALAVDVAYDELMKDGVAGDLSMVSVIAATLVHRELENPDSLLKRHCPELAVPAAETRGYDIAKRASRWWNFRQAYLQDISPVYEQMDEDAENPWKDFGLDPVYDSYRQKLEIHYLEQGDAGDLLIGGDLLYAGIYAELERERVKRERRGEILLDPLQLENQQFRAVLLNVFDQVLITPPLQPPGPEGGARADGVVYDGAGDMTYQLRRHDIKGLGLTYWLNLYDGYEPKLPDQTRMLSPYMMARLTERQDGIIEMQNVTKLGGPGNDISTIANLARVMRPDDYDFRFRRVPPKL